MVLYTYDSQQQQTTTRGIGSYAKCIVQNGEQVPYIVCVCECQFECEWIEFDVEWISWEFQFSSLP